MLCSIHNRKNNKIYPDYSKALNAPLQTNTLQARVGFYPSVRTR